MTFGIDQMGLSSLKERWIHEKFDVVRVFWYDPLRSAVIKQTVEMLSTPYLGIERQRIVPNIYEVVWQLELQMEAINRA